MNKYRFQLLLTLGLILSIYGSALAQAEELKLSLSRDFGYSSGTGSIQGRFSMKISGPEDLVRVVFLIDGQSVYEDSEAPFRFQFTTDSYSLGIHTLNSVGYTSGGLELHSNEYRREFVSAEEGWKSAGKFAIPILAFSLAVMVLSFVLPTLLGRGKRTALPQGAPRNYGFSGGTICPKCGRPFAMHFFGMNLLVGRLDRCPYCGRWSLVRHRSLAELRAAELAELENAQTDTQLSAVGEEERLRKDLEDSRFHDA